MRIRVSEPCDFTRGHLARPLLPELDWCGFDVWTRGRPQTLGKHLHGREWEVHFQIRGHIEQWISDRHHIVRANDLFVMAPGAVHSGMNRIIHRCEMCWLGFRLPPVVAFPGLDASAQLALSGGFAAIQPVPFQAEAGLLPAFAGLLAPLSAASVQAGESAADPSTVAILRAHFHHILYGILRSWTAHQRRHHAQAVLSPTVLAAIALLRERVAAPLRVAALARAVGLSRSALSERFVAETGLSPAEYLMRLRIERAKALLAETTLSEAAFALGFASAQHFGTAFKLYTGLTPGAFRRQLRQSAHGEPDGGDDAGEPPPTA